MVAVTSFSSVPARFVGRVVFRVHRSGSVWARRAPRAGDRPPPACLFLPAASRGAALQLVACADFVGWSAEVKPAASCAVWRAGPLAAAAPPWACKVRLPAGVNAAGARAALAAAALQLALQGA
jgi:hypothetical protein